MLRIDQTNHLGKQACALQNLERKALSIKKQEEELPVLIRIVKNIFFPVNRELALIGRDCCKVLDEVEKIPTVLNANDEHKHYYSTCIKTAQMVSSILSSSSSSRIKRQTHELMLRVAALQYRIEGASGGLDRAIVDSILTNKLCTAALQWKQEEELIVQKELTEDEIKKMEEVSAYPESARILLDSKSLQEKFFDAHLRDNNDVIPAIQFPATFARLKSVYISPRTGKIPGSLQILIDNFEKVIALPFRINHQKQYISILDESKEVELDVLDERRETIVRSQRVKISDIFQDFSERNLKMGEYELFADYGITFWNCHNLGSMDLTLPDWWKRLPIISRMTKDQLESRISDSLEMGEWVVFAKASRSTPDMDLDKRHGFIEIAIPQEDGSYCIYPFGIFPEKFPNTLKDLMLFLGNTARAKISYPDENSVYSHRQQATHPIKLTEEEGLGFMKTLQKELILARYGHKIFQFGAENCAYWAQTILNTIIGKEHNYYKIDYVKSYPLNPILKQIFNFFRALPLYIRSHAMRAVDNCFGSYRGFTVFENRKRVYKSHSRSHVREEFVIYQPGHLHKQILDGKIKGYISLGNC